MIDQLMGKEEEKQRLIAKTEQIRQKCEKMKPKTEQERKILAGYKRLLRWLEKEVDSPLRSK